MSQAAPILSSALWTTRICVFAFHGSVFSCRKHQSDIFPTLNSVTSSSIRNLYRSFFCSFGIASDQEHTDTTTLIGATHYAVYSAICWRPRTCASAIHQSVVFRVSVTRGDVVAGPSVQGQALQIYFQNRINRVMELQ